MLSLRVTSIVRAVADHVEGVYPLEGCGLILDTNEGLRVTPIRNRALRPSHGFEFDPEELLGALKSGSPVAVFHSHPDGSTSLSTQDREQAVIDGQPWFPGASLWVLSVSHGRADRCAEHRWTPSGWALADEVLIPPR